jgi:steroid delta-isomerase-like uncharacterized protein
MADNDLTQAARDAVSAFNNNDWGKYQELFTSDCLYDEVGTSRRLEGLDAIVQALKGWKEAMPDVKGTVTNAVSTGNTVTLEVTWQGTHTGPLQGPSGTVPATGKQQTTRASWVLDFEGGKVKASRHYFDMLSFMQQLGVLPG